MAQQGWIILKFVTKQIPQHHTTVQVKVTQAQKINLAVQIQTVLMVPTEHQHLLGVYLFLQQYLYVFMLCLM